MKKVLLAVLLAVVALAGCAVPAAAPQTPAQIQANLVAQVKKACLVVQPTIRSLQAQTTVLTEDQINDLANAATLANNVCTEVASATAVESTSVSDFIQAAFPVVIRIVNTAPIDPASKASVSAALTVAQVALSVALAQ